MICRPDGRIGRRRGATLVRRDDGTLFGFAVGPQSWKQFLHPPIETVWTSRKAQDGISVTAADRLSPKLAFLCVRACEIHAIAIQDQVFCNRPYPDVAYEMRRQDAFIVAVNCGRLEGPASAFPCRRDRRSLRASTWR